MQSLDRKHSNSVPDFSRLQMGKIRWMRQAFTRSLMRRRKKLLKQQGFSTEEIRRGGLRGLSKTIRNEKKLAEELGIGEITLQDIVKELEKPGRDPREEMPKPILRTDVLEMKDLTEGMVLKGTVRKCD